MLRPKVDTETPVITGVPAAERQITPGLDESKFQGIMAEVRNEVRRACCGHAPMHSLHEGYAVLLEEVDELWEVVKQNPRKCIDRDLSARSEAIQVAAMAIRLLHDVL